ncbi:MAG: glycosyltransferase [Nitrosopumilus sp.]|nr:glycosyltransferase [Nitrosopumilus sp.]MDH3340510.1 glycosyltransferase [Nitrosopumilus sp.]
MIPFDGIYSWHSDISAWQLLLILFFPITFDYIRTFGKIAFLELNKRKNRDGVIESYFKVHDKKISILIPAHNEESCIHESIEASLATFYPNKEIIVIDDGSTDNTYNIAKKYADKNLIKLVHIKKGGSKAAALNFGYTYSTGDIVITMDADTKLECHSLEKIIRKFDDQRIVAVSGNIIPLGDDHVTNLLTKIQSNEYAISFEIGKRISSCFNILLVISGAFGVFRRNALNWDGLFCTNTMTEDFDKSIKIQKMGQIISFAEKSFAHSFCPNNWRLWITQRTRWAHGHLQTLLKNKDVLFSSRYRLGFRLAVLDTWFTDVVLTILYFVGLTVLALLVGAEILQNGITEIVSDLAHVIILMFFIYFISEITIFFYSRNLSERPQPKKMVYLIPVMMFFYRPLLKIIVFRGYIKAIFRIGVKW